MADKAEDIEKEKMKKKLRNYEIQPQLMNDLFGLSIRKAKSIHATALQGIIFVMLQEFISPVRTNYNVELVRIPKFDPTNLTREERKFHFVQFVKETKL